MNISCFKEINILKNKNSLFVGIKIFALPSLLVIFLLSGCVNKSLKAPCPNFGSHCHKTPINAWSYKNASIL